MAAIHAFLVITLRANQIVSGLALTIFAGGLGLSAYVGTELGLADVPAMHQFGALDVLGLGDLPVVGPILFDQSALVYASWVLTLLVALYLGRTRWGLNVRAVGEAPASADAMGVNVTLYRYVHVVVGGAFSGVARGLLQPFHHARLDSRRHARRRRGLDRHRARDLRVLACRPLSRRRVSLRGAVGAPVRAPGSRGGRDSRVPLCAPVRDDDHRAGARLDRPVEAQARGARLHSGFHTCARKGRTIAWTSSRPARSAKPSR